MANEAVFLGNDGVSVAAAGALGGDGQIGNPLQIEVDGSTVTINGSNQLVSSASASLPVQVAADGDPVLKNASATTVLSVNSAGNVQVTNPLVATGTYVAPTSTLRAVTASMTVTGAQTANQAYLGIDGTLSIAGTNNTGAINGLFFNVSRAGSGSTTSLRGVYVDVGIDGSASVTNLEGLRVDSPFDTSSGAVTNAYGLRISDQTLAGTTLNYAIDVNGEFRVGPDGLTTDLGAAGVRLSGANGVLTVLGLGDGSDENLTWDFNTTAQTVLVGSGTGVTKIDYGTIITEGKFNSSDGSAGVTAGPFTVITGITVKDGLVTALTGT